MPATVFYSLPELSRPLLDKFYREHRSPMRAGGEARLWVAKQTEIVGGLCLTDVADGQWLTGLFVAPAMRGHGIAGRLIDAALAEVRGPVWLFCHPDLLGFYRRSGFEPAANLPQTLAGRFERYSRTKPLIALIHTNCGSRDCASHRTIC
ncbi:MAG: N-acetyltransferase [Pseudomonas sp.]|nr:N-acetyltransferase [Pseudomonas sp.]